MKYAAVFAVLAVLFLPPGLQPKSGDIFAGPCNPEVQDCP